MSKKISELLELLRESDVDPSAAVSSSDPAKEPGAEANREVSADEEDSLVGDAVKDLDRAMGDTLLPEGDLMAASGAPIADPSATPSQPQVSGKGSTLSDGSEVSVDELLGDLDPEIAELIRVMGESEEANDQDSDEDQDEDRDDTKEPLNAVDNISLSEEEIKDVVAKAESEAEAAEGGVEKETEDDKELPGTDELPSDQRVMIKRLFDESVSKAVQSKLAQVVQLTEEKLKTKFKQVTETRDAKLNEQVSLYLEYVVDTWRKQNEPKLFTAAQVKVAQKIFESVKALVETFDIETVDVSAQLIGMYEEKISKLEKDSNKLVSENAELVKEVSLRDRALVIEEAAKGLPLTEIDNFRAVVAKIKAEDLETFRENVLAMRVSFAPKAKKTESIQTTNETLALQGGIRVAPVSGRSEAEIIANLILSGSESNK